MNKVILMGRLTRDPEVRYSNAAEPVAIARYSLAVNRRTKRDGQPDADFINVVAFGASGEFAEKYFKKGQQVSVVGRLQTNTWEDQTGTKRYSTEVLVEEQFFADSRPTDGSSRHDSVKVEPNNAPGFYPVDESIEDDDLPF